MVRNHQNLLSAKGPIDHVSMLKNKMKRPETKVCVNWVTAEIKGDHWDALEVLGLVGF